MALSQIKVLIKTQVDVYERERERILLRSIVNMMIHVQIKITMKDYVD